MASLALTDLENELMVTRGKGWLVEVGWHRLRVWDRHVHAAVRKTDNQQGPAYSIGNSAQQSIVA